MAKNNPVGMVNAGFETISLSDSTALALNTTTALGKVFCLSVETNDIRWRADSTSPTVNTGVVFKKDTHHWIYDIAGSQLTFQRSTGTAAVSVQAWKYKGE